MNVATHKHKTQILAGETTGFMVRENTHKQVSQQNVWLIQLASNLSDSEAI